MSEQRQKLILALLSLIDPNIQVEKMKSNELDSYSAL